MEKHLFHIIYFLGLFIMSLGAALEAKLANGFLGFGLIAWAVIVGIIRYLTNGVDLIND